MSIVEILITITLLYTVMIVVMAGLVISLTWVFKTWAWYALAAGLVVVGGIRITGLLRLPSAIIKAQSEGTMITNLNLEQWATISLTFLGAGLMTVGFAKLRGDLRRIGR